MDNGGLTGQATAFTKAMRKRNVVLTALLVSVLATACENKKAEGPQERAKPNLTYYKKITNDGWINLDNVILWKENPTLEFKKYGKWIMQKWLGITSMRNRAKAVLPPTTVLAAPEEKVGVNPSIGYNCQMREYYFYFGAKVDGIHGSHENNSYMTVRIDGGKVHYAQKVWQMWPVSRQGVDPVSGDIKGKPTGSPSKINEKDYKYLIGEMMTAKTVEVSWIPEKDKTAGGIYARWDFDKTLKDLKDSGDMDRACEMMVGADYITVDSAKTKTDKNKKQEAAKQ